VKNGEKIAYRQDAVLPASLTIGEIFSDGILLPVLHGEKCPAGR
jgi:hypothetical protein